MTKDLSIALRDTSALLKTKFLSKPINAFWYTKVKNFGDLLTPELLQSYGFRPIETDLNNAKAIGVGSLLHMLNSNYEGIILGSGLIRNEKRSLPNANFKIVRGELSKHNLGLSNNTPTGDLGLLSKRLLRKKNAIKKYELGIIPHYVDAKHPWIKKVSRNNPNVKIINVKDTATNVINQIAECDTIMSSSLHGVIVSDALNIPNAWLELSNKVIGNGFKFDDYNTSIDFEQNRLKIDTHTTLIQAQKSIVTKPFKVIEIKQKQLESIFLSALNELNKAG